MLSSRHRFRPSRRGVKAESGDDIDELDRTSRIYQKKPEDLVPIETLFNFATRQAAILTAVQDKLEDESEALRNDRKLSQLVLDAVDGFNHVLSTKRSMDKKLHQFSRPRRRWIWAINKVLVNNYVEKARTKIKASSLTSKWYINTYGMDDDNDSIKWARKLGIRPSTGTGTSICTIDTGKATQDDDNSGNGQQKRSPTLWGKHIRTQSLDAELDGNRGVLVYIRNAVTGLFRTSTCRQAKNKNKKFLPHHKGIRSWKVTQTIPIHEMSPQLRMQQEAALCEEKSDDDDDDDDDDESDKNSNWSSTQRDKEASRSGHYYRNRTQQPHGGGRASSRGNWSSSSHRTVSPTSSIHLSYPQKKLTS
mmetsp:Transcript_595/g.838  ORF Transcript_595/g.838 Transcript_595/m.838 type:complete len:363 (-) Transcript_595:522-1610(-)